MKKYYGIELLRFFSSVGIMVYHYSTSFFYLNLGNAYPFSSSLNLIYIYGDYAVSTFFVISGLVFSNIYLRQNNNESLKKFFIKRFARLYPLHILTLILILFLQLIFLQTSGSFQLYPFIDLYHFILHVFFAYGWGLEEGRAFNSPIWTVSLEVVIYFIFFFSIKLIKKYKIFLVLFIYCILLFIDKGQFSQTSIARFLNHVEFIGFCKLFFSGVFVFLITEKFKNFNYLMIFSILGIALSFVGNFKLYLFCPNLLLFFVLIDNFKIINKIKELFQLLGSLTYSIYLFHTVTFLIAFFILSNTNTIDLFYSNYFFIIYLLVTILISFYSFTYFEKPINIKIRKKLIKN